MEFSETLEIKDAERYLFFQVEANMPKTSALTVSPWVKMEQNLGIVAFKYKCQSVYTIEFSLDIQQGGYLELLSIIFNPTENTIQGILTNDIKYRNNHNHYKFLKYYWCIRSFIIH